MIFFIKYGIVDYLVKTQRGIFFFNLLAYGFEII